MQPLDVYYLKQAGRAQYDTGIEPVYSASHFLQREHGSGTFFGSLFRWDKSVLWKVAKALGRVTFHTEFQLLSDIAENRSPEVIAGDIVSRHVTESKRN